MKVVILAGGYGTRISEESRDKPKPMIEIDSRPLLWYVMQNFYRFGFKEFIICTGYKGYMINSFFASYFLNYSDVSFDFSAERKLEIHKSRCEDWKVSVIDTGVNTMTGGRIKRIREYVGDEPFLLTYGDGVSDVDIEQLLIEHRNSGNIVTLTAVQPFGRFGTVDIDKDNQIQRFAEKDREDVEWINGGYMVVEPEIFSYIRGDETVFEREPLEQLVKQHKIGAYRHKGYWQCVDTMRDKYALEEYVRSGKLPWSI